MPYVKKPIDELIKRAIEANPEAANDDKVLLAEVWARQLSEQGTHVSPKQIVYILRHTSNPESITRRRRIMFNMQIISYSKEAEKRRFKLFKETRDEYSDSTMGLDKLPNDK